MGVLYEVEDERKRQNEKWGEQNHHPFHFLAILGEEVGEANQAALKSYSEGGNWDAYRAELIQVAAVAVAMVECYDRNFKNGNLWYLLNSEGEQLVKGTYSECLQKKEEGWLIVHENELHNALK